MSALSAIEDTFKRNHLANKQQSLNNSILGIYTWTLIAKRDIEDITKTTAELNLDEHVHLQYFDSLIDQFISFYVNCTNNRTDIPDAYRDQLKDAKPKNTRSDDTRSKDMQSSNLVNGKHLPNIQNEHTKNSEHTEHTVDLTESREDNIDLDIEGCCCATLEDDGRVVPDAAPQENIIDLSAMTNQAINKIKQSQNNSYGSLQEKVDSIIEIQEQSMDELTEYINNRRKAYRDLTAKPLPSRPIPKNEDIPISDEYGNIINGRNNRNDNNSDNTDNTDNTDNKLEIVEINETDKPIDQPANQTTDPATDQSNNQTNNQIEPPTEQPKKKEPVYPTINKLSKYKKYELEALSRHIYERARYNVRNATQGSGLDETAINELISKEADRLLYAEAY